MKNIRVYVCLLLNILYISLVAQEPKITFKQLSWKEGLSQSPIFSIMQDKQGFVWIGSRNGLTRYDGYEFKVYHNNEFNKSTSQRDINAILEDWDDNLWLATSGGLYRFSRTTEKFTKISIGDIKFTSSLYPAGDNKMWITTDKGIKILDCKNSRVSNFISHQTSGLFVHTICKDSKGLLWSGSVVGIRCYKANNGQTVPVPASLAEKLNRSKKIRIFSIKEDLQGDLWIGTESSGVFWYKRSTGACINFQHNNKDSESILSDFVKDIFVNNANEIWIGTRNGLSIFDKKTQKFSNYEHQSDVKGSLSNNTIWKIMKDRSGSIWIATYAGGLNIYSAINKNFETISERIGTAMGLNKPVINALEGDADGGIWAGTSGGGLNYINLKKGTSRYYSVQDPASRKTSNIVKALVKDTKNGTLWVATLDGLAKFDPNTAKVSYVTLPTATFRANALLGTAQGIWLGGDTDGLIFRSSDGKLKSYRYQAKQNSINSNHINSLLEDAGGKGLWIGTPSGICYLDYATDMFTNYNVDRGDFRSNVIISMFRDSKQRFWLGTQLGLRLFDPKSKENFSFTKSNGLTDNTIQSITQDNLGNLWLSTSNGISQINFKNHQKHLSSGSYEIVNYTSLDGLSGDLWMPNTVYNNGEGMIFFGGVNGINYFRPAKIIKNTQAPKVVITDFLVKNEPITTGTAGSPLKEPIELTRKIKLKYNQNSFSFKFSALNFINSQKNSYAYKMEGLSYNQDWNFAGSQRLATYTGLEPGTYIFNLKAANNDGIWSNSPYTIQVTILPPFWATWWAYTIYWILAIVLFYFIIRFFRRQAKLERDLFYEHLQLERQQELHQMKLNFFTNISHEIRTPLTLIAAPVEKLVKETESNNYLNKQLKMIQSNTSRLLKLINELMDFRKTETGNMQLHVEEVDINSVANEAFIYFMDLAEANNIDYVFQGVEHPVNVFIDTNQMEKVLFNLLSNAFKFTPPGGIISLQLRDDDNEIQLKIVDNGPGIPLADQENIFTDFYQGGVHNPKHIGTGIGLAFSKSIVDLHHGSLTFKSNPVGEPGTSFTEFILVLEKGTEHFNAEELLNNSLGSSSKQSILASVTNDSSQTTFDDMILDSVNEYRQSILVVEDNDEVREFLLESLRSHYLVTGCENGRLGYENAIVEIPDLIITDVMMPEMDGLQLCEKIKSDPRTNHIPVIMLTARAAPVHQIGGLSIGADIYIAKPFSLEILLLNIKNLMQLRRSMQEKFTQQVTLQPKDIIIPSKDGEHLNKLISIIENRMEDSDFGVAELATEIGMSQPVLYRKVKALTDLSVADFIKSIRLKRAAMLLVQQKMTIADVAFAVGFNNRKHFSKEFRKQFNESPSNYMTGSSNNKDDEQMDDE